jgi:hypothetical protein
VNSLDLGLGARHVERKQEAPGRPFTTPRQTPSDLPNLGYFITVDVKYL